MVGRPLFRVLWHAIHSLITPVFFDATLSDLPRLMTSKTILPARRSHITLGERFGTVAGDTGRHALMAHITL